MARKATSLTKGRKSQQDTQPAPIGDQGGVNQKRRGRKQPLQLDEMQPAELFPADAVVAGNEAQEPESKDFQKLLHAKARRGRKPKVSAAPETVQVSATDVEVSSDEQVSKAEGVDLVSAMTPIKSRGKRSLDSQPSLLQSTLQTDPHVEVSASSAILPDQSVSGAPAAASSAAKWNAATGTISFDWPAIEQAAVAEGPNQAMAKLLLAARDEGANSRWPF